jgi:hypothetical protein
MGAGSGGLGGGGYGGPNLAYYLSLLTSEWQASPKFLSWVTALLTPLVDLQSAALAMYAFFDINNAIGAQLDALGTLVGQSRQVPFQPSDGVSPILDDNTYRILLQAKIAQNQFDGQIDSLYAVWAQLFPGTRFIFIDNMNMTATVEIAGVFTSILQDLITNGLIVPRPQGVEYTYSFATLPLFGVDLNNSIIAGVDVGHIA